jgi:hypothetical protein
MAYIDNFRLADDLIPHLNTVVSSISDPFLVSRYAGFVSVAAATVYELAIKEIFCSFGEGKHVVLGTFTRTHFDRINGRIKYKSLHEEHVACFGTKYVRRFKDMVQKREGEIMRQSRVSIVANYNNVILWRHQFAHEGQVPTSATYGEVVDAYEVGKEVINCLARSMRR